MTNEQRIREEISTTKKLAEHLVIYNDDWGMFYASDGCSFYNIEEAIEYEVEWLRRKSDI